MIRAALVAGTTLVMAGCLAGPVPVAGAPEPILSRQDGERLMLQADSALATAYRDARPDGLSPLFGDAALGFEQRRVDERGRRGDSRQERDVKRRLVQWNAGTEGGEGVLELSGQVRLVSPERPDPPWTGFVRQWRARLEWVAGDWKVVDEQYLSPAAGWPP